LTRSHAAPERGIDRGGPKDGSPLDADSESALDADGGSALDDDRGSALDHDRGSTLDADRVETPVGYVDLVRVRRNAERVARYAEEHGLGWRPHIKTHKSREIARIQLEAGARGLTVATLREAEVMAAMTDDLLLAYPPVGRAKLDRLVRLPHSVNLTVGLDSVDVLGPLARACGEAGRTVGILIEQDVGLGRVGVAGADEVVDLAREVAGREGVRFRGVMFYPGHIRTARSEQDEALSDLSRAVSATRDALRRSGLEPEIVSGGSTPTLWRSHEVAGLTEIRSGSCIYNDREAVTVGVAGPGDLAYSVLATVVSTSVSGRAVVDAGSKALAKETRGPGHGYGSVLGRPEVRVAALSEEHGVLDVSGSAWRPAVGDRVRLVPNHVCVSVNLQDRLVVDDEGALRWMALEGRGRGVWTG